MIIYTIGFTKRTAKEFFDTIHSETVDLLIDIRLNNTSQLAGFTKSGDIEYFLEKICSCKYDHDPALAPTKEILNDYKKGIIDWEEYSERFLQLMQQRSMVESFVKKYISYEKVCLLCSELSPVNCHRRLVAETLNSKNPAWEIRHL